MQFKVQPVANGIRKIEVTGLHTEPSAQGIGLYKAAMTASQLDGTTCATKTECINKEIEAAGKYLESNYWKNTKIKDQKGKITKVMELYDSWATRKVIGSDWPKIFYSMITASGSTIIAFFFTDGKVYATSEEYDMNGNKDYAKYHLKQKSAAMGAKSLTDAANTMALAEKFARSGINFAKMLAFGNDEVRANLERQKIKGGDPEAVANLLRWCENSKPGTDPKCKDKTPGRISWSSVPCSTMTENPEQ